MNGGTPMRSRVSQLTVPVGDDDHVQGPRDAPVTLVQYGDFECPFCKAAYSVVRELQDRYGPQLRVVFRHFPMKSMHPHARQAAMASEAAAMQDERAFWAMHDLLYEHQGPLDDDAILECAETLGLEMDRFRADLASETVDQRVQADFLSGARSGVNGTPSFYVDGVRYDGPHTAPMFGAAIERRLRGY